MTGASIKPDIEPDLHFNIHASVVFQLGESLITDAVQALTELVKNAYDADSLYVNVVIDTTSSPGPHSRYEKAHGYISIYDGGEGMDLPQIEQGWLTISNSPKRSFKERREQTKLGRTPVGDKGVGRLGAQRLGDNLEIFTRREGKPEHHVAFSWQDFLSVDTLDKVSIHYNRVDPPNREKGTALLISNLRDASSWSNDKAITELETELSRLISPFREVKDFQVVATVNGRSLQLAEITKRVRETAQVRYTLDFDDTTLHIHGKVRLNYFRPDNEQELHEFTTLVEADGGAQFFEFLSSKRKARDLHLVRSEDSGWFVEYSSERALDALDALELVKGVPANPGPFHGEVDSFDLGRVSVAEQSIFDNSASFRGYIANHSGVRPYRDGFGIHVERDWLGLGKGWTSGKSYYGLKPNNTVGFISISARDNAKLEETTDRQGFKITPYYHNFYELLQQFVRFQRDASNFIRRGWVEFRRKHRENAVADDTGIDTENSVSSERLSYALGLSLGRAPQFTVALQKARDALSEAPAKAGLDQARKLLVELEAYTRELSKLSGIGEVLYQRTEVLREQLVQLYDVASLGLTVEALSHEMLNVLDQLEHRNRQLIEYLRKRKITDVPIVSYTRYIGTTISGLRKQLSHLEPSLKYVREKRERIVLRDFFHELEDYYRIRFADDNITVNISTSQPGNQDNFVLFMNKGKLIQIFDNMFLNSQYWLSEALRRGHFKQGRIDVVLAKPLVCFSDNGPGIDRSVEASLLEPFVTTKGRGQGRGLGLFIVQQLLASEDCSIALTSQRNANGRLYKFELDFTGALDVND